MELFSYSNVEQTTTVTTRSKEFAETDHVTSKHFQTQRNHDDWQAKPQRPYTEENVQEMWPQGAVLQLSFVYTQPCDEEEIKPDVRDWQTEVNSRVKKANQKWKEGCENTGFTPQEH